jgi:hypothetical protein
VRGVRQGSGRVERATPSEERGQASSRVSEFRLRRPQTILSLCDGLGSWSQPYVDADYDVVRMDLDQTGQDVRLMRFPAKPIHGILAAPPCTVFANSGNRWPRTEQEIRDGLSVVDACLRIVVATQPVWWVLENPPGRLSSYLGPPRLTFQPNEYGDDYTKQTNLWGTFTAPMRSPVPATAGSKMHRLGPSADRAALRSVTPAGFARAFFEANP